MANNSPVSRNRRASATKSGNGKNGHTALYSLPTLYRGIYNRVAEKIGCDPSYVSRVARGERTSDAVARALEAEIRHTLALSSRHLNARSGRDGASRARALRA
ncbi:MAG TPA: hypothetical protein VMT53_14245 [Terriglobales bacterium]|nr:hypothetical protein [Terriglobales bacterium]